MIAMRGDRWCCLVCSRQFRSGPKLRAHLERSDLHARNLGAGSVDLANSDRHGKRERAAQAAPSGGSAAVGLSALEQMQLFEKRLKVEARRQPEKAPPQPATKTLEGSSSNARSVNKQMDWECGHCDAFNFARVIVCHKCHRHVDASTRYLSNRLKEIKQQRFANLLQGGDDNPDGSAGHGT